MGTTLVSTLISRGRGILQDSDSTSYTWSDADLLSYLDDGQRDIIFLKPNAYVVNEVLQLAAGTKQTVQDGIALIKLTRFMGTDGTTAGDVINFVPMEQLNYQERSWHSETACATPELYTYDEDDPTYFYVYPPQPTTGMGYVEEVHVGMTATLDATTDAIGLNDIYQTPLLNYMLYRAYSREVDSQSAALAEKYYNLYLRSLGLKGSTEEKPNG